MRPTPKVACDSSFSGGKSRFRDPDDHARVAAGLIWRVVLFILAVAIVSAAAGCDHPPDPWEDPSSSGFDEEPIECCSEDDCATMLCVDGRMQCPVGMEPDGEVYWCTWEPVG